MTFNNLSGVGFLSGLPIIIISEKDNGDQRRSHKKKRINKKWRKRYGTVSTPIEKGQYIVVKGAGVYMSRKTYSTIKGAIKAL